MSTVDGVERTGPMGPRLAEFVTPEAAATAEISRSQVRQWLHNA